MQHSLLYAKLLTTTSIGLLNYINCSLHVGLPHFYKGIICI